MKGYIHSVETFGAVDGPGVRYVVFFQGCPIRCLYCHNPDSWNKKQGKITNSKDIINDILKYKNYITRGGVTISGGEPLLQPKFAYKLIKELKKHNINVAIDTAGSIFTNDTKKVLKACDLVLLDIKAQSEEMYKLVTGVSKENNAKTLDYLKSINKKVWIRHVLLPNYTLNFDEINALANYLLNYKDIVERVEIIPFHKMGEYKWKELKLDYKLYNINPPDEKDVTKAKQMFTKLGFKVD